MIDFFKSKGACKWGSLVCYISAAGFSAHRGDISFKKEKYQVTETIIQKKLDSSALIRSPLWHRASQRSRVFLFVCFFAKISGLWNLKPIRLSFHICVFSDSDFTAAELSTSSATIESHNPAKLPPPFIIIHQNKILIVFLSLALASR